MVERGVVVVGFFGGIVASLAEKGPGWVKDRAAHPLIKVVGVSRGVVLNELPAVGRCAANDGVRQHCGAEIGYSPELPGKPEFECRDYQFESRPSAKRRVSCQKLAHKGQGR